MFLLKVSYRGYLVASLAMGHWGTFP